MNERLKVRRCLKRKTLQHWSMQVWVILFTGSMSRDSDSLRAGRSGIESRWRRDFPHPSKPALRPTQPPILRVPGFLGDKADGAWSWPPTPSSAEVKEWVGLYLYSPSGPSWPVLGWTLPLPIQRIYLKVIAKQKVRMKINGLKVCT
jgi:hypothetical protein